MSLDSSRDLPNVVSSTHHRVGTAHGCFLPHARVRRGLVTTAQAYLRPAFKNLGRQPQKSLTASHQYPLILVEFPTSGISGYMPRNPRVRIPMRVLHFSNSQLRYLLGPAISKRLNSPNDGTIAGRTGLAIRDQPAPRALLHPTTCGCFVIPAHDLPARCLGSGELQRREASWLFRPLQTRNPLKLHRRFLLPWPRNSRSLPEWPLLTSDSLLSLLIGYGVGSFKQAKLGALSDQGSEKTGQLVLIRAAIFMLATDCLQISVRQFRRAT